jgi:hypothetical protein
LHSPLSYGDSVAEFRFGVLPYPWDPRKVRRAPVRKSQCKFAFPQSAVSA